MAKALKTKRGVVKRVVRKVSQSSEQPSAKRFHMKEARPVQYGALRKTSQIDATQFKGNFVTI